MHVSSTTSTIDQIVSKQFTPLRQQLNILFSKYPPSLLQRTTFDDKLKKLFIHTFSIPLPTSIQQCALDEHKLVQSIRCELKKDNLILRRTADQNNVYYLGNASLFEQKANDYMTNTTSYQLIEIINENHSQLDEIIKSIDSILQDLHRRKRIKNEHLPKMNATKSNIQLPYLYFLPEFIQQNGPMFLQPMISSSKYCPIQPLADYLNELLRPLYDTYAQSTTLSNGTDFIERLLHYEKNGLLPTTRFVTLKISNFYTMIPHDGIIEALGQFLSDVLVTGHRYKLSIETIQQLTELVLHNNVFTYNGKLYRHVKKGSPSSLPLTRILGNIFLHEWQRSFLQQLGENHEFYGRYNDTVFLTWNGSDNKLQSLLNELNGKHSNIQSTRTIGSNIHFLGAFIENRQGHLYTRVYHDPNVPRFVLPYVNGHPRIIYQYYFQWALIRAVRYCKLVEDFDQERLNIEFTFLTNQFSLDYVNYNLQQFFNELGTNIQPGNLNQIHYEKLRQRVLQRVECEKQDFRQQQQWNANHTLIHLHYLYDWGPRHEFNQKFDLLWNEHFGKDTKFPETTVKPVLHATHCYMSNALLSRQAPPPSHRIN